MAGLLEGILEITADLSAVISAKWLTLSGYIAIWFVLHAVAEFGIPALFPSAYDFIGRKEAAKGGGGKPIPRRKLAADMRNKIVATLMAGYLVPLCFWALFVTSDDSHRALRDTPYGSTPLSDHIVLVAASYFTWDVYICVADRAHWTFIMHGCLCWLVYMLALHPFLHYMSIVCLLYEASTPFLHLRTGAIQAGLTSGWAFRIIEYLFAGLFFVSRITFGLSENALWWLRTQAMLRGEVGPRLHSAAVVYTVMGMCAILSTLNVVWMVGIISLVAGSHARDRKAAQQQQQQQQRTDRAGVGRVLGSTASGPVAAAAELAPKIE